MKKEEITLKNTKAEILDALKKALEREKNMSQLKYEPEKEAKQQKVEKAVEASRMHVEQKIFSEELNKKFQDLELAIQEEERKLNELYGIGKELSNLVVVINAGRDWLTNLENTKLEKTNELNEQIKSLEEDYFVKNLELEKEYKNKNDELEKEYKELKEDYKIKAKNLEIQRAREKEEYDYKTNREREISNNQWVDEKTKREKDLATKELELSKLLNEVEAKAEHLKELEDVVSKIPEQLDKEYAKGRKDAITEIEKENKYKTEILKKDYENIIDRQNDKIETLKAEVEKLTNEKVSMQEKLDHAYNQIKDMATKTVEATGGVKILGNNTNE